MRTANKNAFAMIMAITVLVIIGTIMALSLAMTTQTTQSDLNTYLYERVEMLADSAREYAMYKIDGTSCVDHDVMIYNQDDFYDINISIKYTGPTQCITESLNFTNIPDTELINATAIIDVTVEVDKEKTIANETIRFYKRYIENIKAK